ncbi:MAG: hypothetical protein LH618_13205 [Saprospiraceae bacterium]|nr:hypothetical protein [Saprospiraceae bacterium]
MKNISYLFILVAATLFTACQQDQPLSFSSSNANHGLTLLTTANPGWQYQNMRVYPIVADAAALEGQGSVQHLTTLAEAMRTPGFRITERKQFGREREWYNGLTVQNKTQDTIYLMSGEVVTGGNQDRILAHDEVLPPASVKNVEVFCVEKGRSSYYDEAAPAVEKQIAAFNGYFSVASPQVRQAVQRTGSQTDVWEAVDKVMAANDAQSNTHTYAGLNVENDKKAVRDAYQQHFASQFADVPNMVGMVVVCGDEVLGVDIFGHPDLFQRQFTALLHGYVTAAATRPGQTATAPVAGIFSKVAAAAKPGAITSAGVGNFSRYGAWVHLYSK